MIDTQGDLVPRRGQLRRADKIMSAEELGAFLGTAVCGRTANVRCADRVCFEADEPGEVFPYGRLECDTSISYRGVIVFGRIRTIGDEQGKLAFFADFMRKYAPADSYGRERGSFPRHGATIVYAITPEVATGKHGLLPPFAARRPNAGSQPAADR